MQYALAGRVVDPEWSLIPPDSPDFSVYGTEEVRHRARDWARRGQYLLYNGPGAHCVHGLYRMDTCDFPACRSVGLDHTQLWVERDGTSAFLLTQPYVAEIPEALRTYGEMHGLTVATYSSDGWYGGNTLPIRMTIPPGWPLWPIERDAAVLLHVQPVRWPGVADLGVDLAVPDKVDEED